MHTECYYVAIKRKNFQTLCRKFYVRSDFKLWSADVFAESKIRWSKKVGGKLRPLAQNRFRIEHLFLRRNKLFLDIFSVQIFLLVIFPIFVTERV